MPNLDRLVLTCLAVGSRGVLPDSDRIRIDSEPNDLTLAIAYPHLAILVRYLESTAVTTFCVGADEGMARWLREDPLEPFERQAW